MANIRPLALQALQTITQPTPEPPPITESVELGFRVIGNETPDELRQLEEMHTEAQWFIADVLRGASPRWLTLYGRSGTGKTLLARAIDRFFSAKSRLESAYNRQRKDDRSDYLKSFSYVQEGPTFVKWERIITAAREGEYWPITQCGRDWFKIIDDIGSEGFQERKDGTARPTAFVTAKLGALVDRRIGKWTVITTNFTRKEFAELFDVRIASRLTRDGNRMAECMVRDWALRVEQAQREPLR
jgi:hypothetical protein